jgi:Major tropism determinant N-terminal domain
MPYSIPLHQRVQLRRDTAANWTRGNPVLKSGELGYETDTERVKIGDGSTSWTSLSYFGGGNLGELQDVTITNAANGDFLRWNGTAWINDAVNLSTDTVGSYVQSLVAGSAITITNNSGEAATPTIAVTANTFETYGAVSAHEADTTNVHGIANTSLLVTTTGTQTLTNKTITSPTFTGTVSGISSSTVGLGNVDNTADANKPVSTATQTALNLKANIASPTFTGTPSAPTAPIGTSTTQIATTEFVMAIAEDAQFILAGQIF